MRVCSGCGQRRHERFFTSDRGRLCDRCRARRRSDAAHARRVLATYEITAEEYAALLAFQGGVCAVCGEPRRYRLNVDHDHAVERRSGARSSVRGLLCRRCNKALRDVRDSVELLLALAAYLQNPPAREVIQ